MENALKEQIWQITKEAKEMFLKRTDRLFLERVKKEHDLTIQYCGREILELLQNIDDAYNPKCGKPCIAKFELEDNCLTVSNYGDPFTIETLQRLCQGSVSSKEGKYIGSKGIGFRSILNWSEKVEIYSQADGRDYVAVSFSREDADSVFNEIKNDEHIQSQIKELKKKNIKASFPIFKAPVPIDPIEGLEYNTVIKIYIQDDSGNSSIRQEIKREFEQFDKNTLLFLPNIHQVEFICDRDSLKYIKNKENNRITITNNGQESESFYYFEDDKTIHASVNGVNNIKMAVAIPCEDIELNCCLYSYFPILNIPSPFNALLHATFCLNANRNNLESSKADDSVNAEVFKELLNYYVSKVTSLNLAERTIKLLSPKNYGSYYKFPGDMARLNVEQFYYDKCRKDGVFYSIDKEYLCADISNAPFIVDEVPQTFVNNATKFNRLVKIDGPEKQFAETILSNSKCCVEEYLINAINDNSPAWGSTDRIQVFKWWADQHFSKFPKLIKDTKGNFIESLSNPCFLSGSDSDTISDVPNWAVINVINKEDEKEIINQFQEEIQEYRAKNKSTEREVRILPRLIDKRFINLQEQSSKQVMISPVNNSIEGNFSRAEEFVRWLWDIWEKQERFPNSLKENVEFNLPSTKSTVRKAKETYLGADFGNELGSRLFSCTDNSFEQIYKIQGINDVNKYSRFLRELGVNKYPTIFSKTETVNFNDNTNYSSYIKYVKDFHKVDFPENVSLWEINVSSISNIDEILRNASTEDILKWIWNDDQLKRLVFVGEETESSYISYKPRKQGQLYFYRWNNGWNLPSYLRFVFSKTQWIKIGEQKFAPNELLISSETQTIDGVGISCIPETVLENIAQKSQVSIEDLKQILQKLGVKESYLDLDSDQFYSLLLRLGNNDCEKSRKISREIYRAIIDNNRGSRCIKSKFYSESRNKELFFKNGKVLAKNRNGEVAYIHISDVFFSSSAVLNIENKYFIDIPPRSGNKDSFEDILGIKSYKQEYSVIYPIVSELDKDFQADFKAFLPYLLAYHSGNNGTLSLSVQLVKSISIKIDNDEQEVCVPYSLLKASRSKWYIYVGNSFHSYDSLNKCKIGESLEQIFNVYYNFPAKDFLSQVTRLFICNKEQRQYFVETELGSTYEYDAALKEIRHSDELKHDLIKGFCLNENDVAIQLIDTIDWFDLSNESVQEKIVKLLQETGKGLDDLSKVVKKPISVSKYNQALLRKQFRTVIDRIKVKIYLFCKSEKKYTSLLDLWDSVEAKVDECTDINDVYFDASKHLISIVDAFFQENGISDYEDEIDLTAVKKVYESQKKDAIDTISKNHLNLNDFTNDSKNDSLLYFKESGWQSEIERFINTSVGETLVGGEAVDDTFSVTDIIDSIILESEPESGEFRRKDLSKKNRGGVTEKGKRGKDADYKKRGNKAEYCVVLALVKKKIKEVNEYFGQEDYSIIWKSGAANEVVKAIGDESQYDTTHVNDAAGYDIELFANNNQEKKLYLEVKSSSSKNCNFYMSANEYDVANKLETSSSKYRIIFVTEESNGKNSISFINAPVKDVFETIATEYNVIFHKEKYDEFCK